MQRQPIEKTVTCAELMKLLIEAIKKYLPHWWSARWDLHNGDRAQVFYMKY